MGRIARGFRLAGASWQCLQADRELLWLPVLSFLSLALVAAVLGLVGWGAGAFSGHASKGLEYVFLAAFYFCSYAIGIYFNAAIVGAATIRLSGGDPTVGDGLRLATSKIGKILGWAAFAATVGLLLRMLEDRAGFLGKIVIAIVGVAWSAVTFFVVPVLLYEPLGVGDSIQRSGQIFKSRWGEMFVGNASIGLAIFLVGIPIAALVMLLFFAAPLLGVLVGVVAFGALAAVGAALSGIYSAALYRFATTGAVSAAFTEDDLQGSFRLKSK